MMLSRSVLRGLPYFLLGAVVFGWSYAMKPVDIYTLDTCPYCHRAMALLQQKNVVFTQYRIDGNAALREAMVQRTGRRTVPQIFVDGQFIGGCDDLYALEAQGKLDAILSGTTGGS